MSAEQPRIALLNPRGNYGAIAESLPHIIPADTQAVRSDGELLSYITLNNPQIVFIDVRTMPEDEVAQLVSDSRNSALASPPRIALLTDIDPRRQTELQRVVDEYHIDAAFPCPFDLTKVVEFVRTVFEANNLPVEFPPEAIAKADPELSTTTIPTIILVEDEPEVTKLVNLYLYVLDLQNQVNIQSTTDAQGTFLLLKTGDYKPNLLVVDYFLPDTNGADLIEILLQDEQLQLSPKNFVIQTAVPAAALADERVRAWIDQGLTVINKDDIPSNVKWFLEKARENLPPSPPNL